MVTTFNPSKSAPQKEQMPDALGRFGQFGGKYVPTLSRREWKVFMSAHRESVEEHQDARRFRRWFEIQTAILVSAVRRAGLILRRWPA